MPAGLEAIVSHGAVQAARELIGWRLYVEEPDGSLTGGPIVETEAYTQQDAANHSYRGQTPRNAVMFGPPGMHWCMNIAVAPPGQGEAVLIRAIIPESNVPRIRERRGGKPDSELTNGPAKVCQALGITGSDNGAVLNDGRCKLLPPKGLYTFTATARIGIRHDTHRLWRFVVNE